MAERNATAQIPLEIDRASGFPVRQQIRAGLVRAIAAGTLKVGAPLPSVRDLAEALGVAPMTVSRTYEALKEAGLVRARRGAGTFVTDSPLARLAASGGIARIEADLEALLERTATAGLCAADVVALLMACAIRSGVAAPRTRLLMVGLFPAATQSYAERLGRQLGEAAEVAPLVLGPEGAPDEAALATLRGADLVVTFAGLEERIRPLAPGLEIVCVRFIPAESTRLALAGLDPRARVAVVSRFADFLPALELGVRRFAPHVRIVSPMVLDAPGLDAVVGACDAVVMSTGAESAAARAREGARRIEYRHIPDPGDVERLVMPRLARGRGRADPVESNEKEAS